MNKKDRIESDNTQKRHLKELGYSDAVIDELFPEKENNSFLTNGQNLINGFVQLFKERKQRKNDKS